MTRRLTLVLLNEAGDEIARKQCAFNGDDKRAEEYGFAVRAKELYRDAFPGAPYPPASRPAPRRYLWGLVEIS